MTAPDWFRFYPAKWHQGTIALTPEQRGVYMDIISVNFDKGFCPEDYEFLRRLCNCQARRLKRIVQELVDLGKLQREGATLIQSKALKERKDSQNFRETQSKRSRNRWHKSNKINNSAHPLTEHNSTDSISPSIEGEIRNSTPHAEAKNGPAKASRPKLIDVATWEPNETDHRYAQDHGLDPDRVLQDVRDWAANAAPSKRRKKDPHAFWRNWVRRDADRAGQGPRPGGGRGGKRSDFDEMRDAVDWLNSGGRIN